MGVVESDVHVGGSVLVTCMKREEQDTCLDELRL